MMKKVNKSLLCYILLFSVFSLFSFACQRVMDDGGEEDMPSSDETALKITARSGENISIEYPVYLYAFNEKGDCAAKQKITSEEVEMNLQLPSGSFKVVALSGVSKGYAMPDNPRINDAITMQEGSCASKAMMMGMADVTLEGKNKTVNLMLTYRVASLNVVLTKADKVKQVKVGVSPLYSSLNFEGKYGGENKTLEIDCSLGTDGRWTAGPVYIFPGSSSQATLSITLEDSKGSHTYGYISTAVPQANHPYNIGGSYTGDISIDGSLIAKGWEDAIDVEFKFGTDGDSSDDEDTDGDEDISGLPDLWSIWNNCIVVNVGEPDNKGVDILLMSLDEWETKIDEFGLIIQNYDVNGIKGWRLPNYEEATYLRKYLNGATLMALNEKIVDKGKTEIYDEGDLRYLCYNKDNILSSFRFYYKSSIVQANNANRTYSLRAVTTYHYSK